MISSCGTKNKGSLDNCPPNGGTQEKYFYITTTLSDLLSGIYESIKKVNDNAELCKLYFIPWWPIHTSLFIRCATTECVPILSVVIIWDLFPINTIIILLFCNFAFMLSNKSFQSMPSFYAALSSPVVRISINCLAKDTGKNIRAGHFPDMLGIG